MFIPHLLVLQWIGHFNAKVNWTNILIQNNCWICTSFGTAQSEEKTNRMNIYVYIHIFLYICVCGVFCCIIFMILLICLVLAAALFSSYSYKTHCSGVSSLILVVLPGQSWKLSACSSPENSVLSRNHHRLAANGPCNSLFRNQPAPRLWLNGSSVVGSSQ